jgi:putative hemolysin
MTQVSLEILLIFVLILANGVFSASEIALVSARKTRLRNRADQGDRRSLAALRLAEDPDKFLSTVQVGITSIGILTGVFGGATIAEQLSQRLEAVPMIGPHGETVALTVVVVVIAYFSVVLGELVPKRIALANAERLAGLMAPLMSTIANLSKPAVQFLSWSSEAIVRMLRIPKSTEPVVTEEELRAMLRLGTASGTFHPAEEVMFRGVLTLADRPASMLMRHRSSIVWLDVNASPAELQKRIIAGGFSRYPVADGGLDKLIGILRIKDVLAAMIAGKPIDVRLLARPALMVPETIDALELLPLLQQNAAETAIVLDEFGSVEGMVTLSDLAATVLGDDNAHEVVTRADGSLLVDGMMKFDDFSDLVRLPGVEKTGYATVAAFVLSRLGRIPRPGDAIEIEPWRFEVIDVDGRRLDKLLVTLISNDDHGPKSRVGVN